MTTDLVRSAPLVPGRFLDFDEAKRHAVVLSKSGLVPKALADNPDAVMLVGLLGQELGVPFIASMKQIHVIEASPSPSAQLQLSLIHRAGHKARFIESSRERAVMRGRQRDDDPADPKSWVEVEWSEEDAREAHLLDEWVERWQKTDGGKNYKEVVRLRRDGDRYVPAEFGATEIPEWAQKEIRYGKVKRKDNWWNYRRDMLRARCASTFCRMVCPEVLLGMDPHTAEERGFDVGQDLDEPVVDDDITDAELVDDPVSGAADRSGQEPAARAAASDPPPPGSEASGPEGEPSVAPAPSGPGWTARAEAAGIVQGAVLRRARGIAEEVGVEAPMSFDDIPTEGPVAERLAAWLGGIS